MRSTAGSASEVLEEFPGEHLHGAAGRIDVGFDQHPLLREVCHQHRLRMGPVTGYRFTVIVRSMSDAARRRPCNGGRLRDFGQSIRRYRVRPLGDLFEKRDIALVRDHRQSLRNRGSDTAGVVEVVVAVHELRERLAGHQLPRFRDHCQSASFVLRRFDEHEVIVELHQHAVVRTAGEPPDARGQRLSVTVTGGGPRPARPTLRRPARRGRPRRHRQSAWSIGLPAW